MAKRGSRGKRIGAKRTKPTRSAPGKVKGGTPGKKGSEKPTRARHDRRSAARSNSDDVRRDDPYFSWAWDTDYSSLGSPDKTTQPSFSVPLLIALRQGTTIAEFVKLAKGLETAIRVPQLYTKPPDALKLATHLTVSVTREFFNEQRTNLQLKQLHEAIERFELGLPGLELPDQLPEARKLLGSARPKVLIAIMDDGLAFAQQRFRRADRTTRVEYLWRQGEVPLVFSGTQIDTTVASCTHARLVDEDEVYRKLRHEDYLAPSHKTLGRRQAHGTHVMDLACGADPGKHDDRAIIGVQFPSELIRDTSGAWLTTHIIAGLWFVLVAADRIASKCGTGPLPIVVNVSYGKFAGSHDGRSVLEEKIDEIVRLWSAAVAPLAVVLPSGNCHLARCHASFSLAPGASRTLHWRVSPDDRTPSFVEMWPVPLNVAGVGPMLKVTVVPPAGGQALTVARGTSDRWPAWPELALWSAAYRAVGPETHRDRIEIAIAPTVALDSTAVAPAGTWEIHVENVDGSNTAQIEAWVQRDDTPYGWPITGRQSWFDHRQYARFEPSGTYDRSRSDGPELAVDDNASYVKRFGSVNAIATGNATVVIGAFRASDDRPAWYTAGGPLRAPGTRTLFTPDAMAVSEDSIACHGVLAAGSRSGARVPMRGTSVASPQIARWLAGRMAAKSAATRPAVHSLASGKDPGAPPIRVDRKGAGRVDEREPPRVSRRAPL